MSALRPDVEEDLHAAFAAHGKRYAKLDKALGALALLVPFVVEQTFDTWAVPIALAIVLMGLAIYVHGEPVRVRLAADRIIDAIRDAPDEVATIAHDQTRVTVGLAGGDAATMRLAPLRALKMVELLAKRCPRARVTSTVGYMPPARVVD